MVIFLTLVAALIASFSQLLFKKGLRMKIRRVRDFLALVRRREIIIGACGYVSSLLIYLYALEHGPLSFVYPMFASTFVFIFLLSVLMLHERFSRSRLAGTLLIFLGIVIVSGAVW